MKRYKYLKLYKYRIAIQQYGVGRQLVAFRNVTFWSEKSNIDVVKKRIVKSFL